MVIIHSKLPFSHCEAKNRGIPHPKGSKPMELFHAFCFGCFDEICPLCFMALVKADPSNTLGMSFSRFKLISFLRMADSTRATKQNREYFGSSKGNTCARERVLFCTLKKIVLLYFQKMKGEKPPRRNVWVIRNVKAQGRGLSLGLPILPNQNEDPLPNRQYLKTFGHLIIVQRPVENSSHFALRCEVS